MLRIARVKKSTFIQTDSDEEKIFSEYSDLTKLVKRHLSPVTASIFAIPTFQENSDEIEWSSELKGQPVQLNSLPKDEQLQAKKLLDNRLSAIARLADELPQQAPETEKLQALLKQALHYPGDEAVYVINGQPVITFWGVGGKTKSTSAPILASTIPVTNGAQKRRKTPRFFSFLGWLVLLALLAFLWYWLANNPVNWKNYNPFIDEYQQLVNEVEEAGDDCFALDKIHQNNILLQRPEEKFALIKQQVEAKLARCEAYKQLLKTIQLAEGNCQELRNILEKSSYLQTPEGLFIKLREQLENDIQLCEYNNLKSKIQSSSDNCPELSNLLANNQYLQKPQGKFVELRQQLEHSVNLCAEFQKLKSKIDSAKDDCPLLTKINTENPYLQQPEGMFIPLKQQVDIDIKNCNAYQSLADLINEMQLDCDKLKQLAAENQYLQNPEGKFIELNKQLNSFLKNCKRKQIENIVNLCPGERPKELAPELVVVFDASGSMEYPSSLQKTQIFERQIEQATAPRRDLFGIPYRPRLSIAREVEILRRFSPEKDSRMRGAKTAVNKLVQKTPNDMDIGLVVLKECPSAQNYGFYSPSKRQQLLGAINKLRPKLGTPLGNAIHMAGQIVDGVNRPATMVVISDGEESCNANPCSVAKKLAAQKPYLTINVVDILGTGAGNCIAKATKNGKVFTARNMQDIIKMTEKAASTAIPKNCKK